MLPIATTHWPLPSIQGLVDSPCPFRYTYSQESQGTANGYLDFNLISLFPPTFKDRENGLRIDLAEALYEAGLSVIRFPGGNMLEGNNNRTYWDWKDSIGPLRYRPGFPGVWDYQQTNGLGLLEYLEWAQDFEAEFGEYQH